MTDEDWLKNALSIDLYYSNKSFDDALSIVRNLKEKHSKSNEVYSLDIDEAHLMCITGKYKEAQPILKRLVDVFESSINTDESTLEKLYLAYSSCLFDSKDYLRFYYYINKYLELVKDSNPKAYITIKQLIA